jgi:hypothetical protein
MTGAIQAAWSRVMLDRESSCRNPLEDGTMGEKTLDVAKLERKP